MILSGKFEYSNPGGIAATAAFRSEYALSMFQSIGRFT
jgi:hypothetical protein